MILKYIWMGLVVIIVLINSGCARGSRGRAILDSPGLAKFMGVLGGFQQGMANENAARLASGGSQARYNQIKSEQIQRAFYEQNQQSLASDEIPNSRPQAENTGRLDKDKAVYTYVDRLAEKCNLTEDQKIKVKAVFDERAQKIRDAHAEVHKLGLSGQDPRSFLQSKIPPIMVNAREKIRVIMTPEQFTIYTNLPATGQRGSPRQKSAPATSSPSD